MERKQVEIPIGKGVTYKDEKGIPILYFQGVILKKFSKFLTGGTEDVIMPIPVFVDMKTLKINTDGLPVELVTEIEEYNKSIKIN